MLIAESINEWMEKQLSNISDREWRSMYNAVPRSLRNVVISI